METNFNFKSQICTDKNQSERLLALGLKKETADCYLFEYEKGKYKVIVEPWEDLIADEEYYLQYKDICFPAWSLHRLLSLIEYDDGFIDVSLRGARYGIHYGYDDGWYDNLYDAVISCIEALIEEKDFNREYLV